MPGQKRISELFALRPNTQVHVEGESKSGSNTPAGQQETEESETEAELAGVTAPGVVVVGPGPPQWSRGSNAKVDGEPRQAVEPVPRGAVRPAVPYLAHPCQPRNHAFPSRRFGEEIY